MLKFSVKTRSEPVVIEDDKGNEVTYTLCQMTGQMADEYRAVQAAKVEIDGDGKLVKILDYRGRYTDLLVRTMRKPNGQLVEITEINQWPDEALEGLYGAAAKLNKLLVDEGAEVDPKKS
jgi:hypothetical protein